MSGQSVKWWNNREDLTEQEIRLFLQQRLADGIGRLSSDCMRPGANQSSLETTTRRFRPIEPEKNILERTEYYNGANGII